ncbi:MAG: FAD-binding oxidoreductase [Clostridia bacterium]|nr:FAD-binding oxidoreductase [Clostridia bacterium]
MSRSTDVAVIGGGAIGAAITYYLAKENIDAILVEKGDIAHGTTSKCDGNVLVHDKIPGFDSRLAKLSQDLFPEITNEIDYDFNWVQKGSLLIIESEEELEAAAKFCQSMKEEGLPVRILDQYEVHQDEPKLAKDIIGGLETQCDGSLDPMALAYGLVHGAKKLGAQIDTYNAVKNIQVNSLKKDFKIISERGEINAKRIVNAAGVWTPEIGKMVGLDIPILPRQGQILVAERTVPVARRKVVEFGYLMAKFEGGNYKRNVTPEMEKYGIAFVFEPTHADNFLIGSSRQFVGMNTFCDIEVLKALAQRARRFFPVIGDINIITSYAGLRPYTPDHLPIISETEIPDFYVASGHEGDGIGLSLITGKLITQMICSKTLDIDIERIRLNRFNSKNRNVN